MEFKSNAKYNQNLEKGSIFTLKDNQLGISIHKYFGCGDALFLNSKALNIDNYDLETEGFNEAVRRAKEIISIKVRELNDMSELFCSDENIEIVAY